MTKMKKMKLHNAGVENLKIAIVKKAVDDYRLAYRKLKKNPKNEKSQWELQALKVFFHSEWFRILCDLDPNYLIERAEKEEDARKPNQRNPYHRKKM